MITTKTKRRLIVLKVPVTKLERFKPIEVTLPSNTARVSGILVTASKI